ncbi:hypothetical protein BaRGS_00023253 [Batillaria attramentaria]|uniref:Uncharacterized protein n=1 Tax=Batillaria attramentaria TaxID=370345 RepID=A0ABD0KEL5_9CAEN
MTASNTDADIATQLHAWAVKEMHFRPQGAFLSSKMPSPDDLKGICRGTQQADLWRYVITHVHSVQTVKKPYAVQYKSDKKYMEEHQALMEQRAQLVGEVTTVLSEVQQLEHEIHRVSKDVQKAEREYQQETESLRDLGRKTCLLNVYRAKCRENTAQCNAYSDQIDEKTTTYSKRIMDAALHLRPDDPSTSLGTLLETSAEKQVRETCEMIGKFLQETLQGTFGRDKSAFKMSKDQLWDLVKDTLSGLDIRQVVGSLVHMSREGVHTLREHTLKINISQDAKKLRFKYEKGGILRDISTPPTKLQSVQQLLEECQMKHVMRFVETEKHRNEAHTNIQALEATRTKIIAALKRYFSSIQHGNLGLAVSLVQAKLDLTADTTAKECYRQEAESLKEKVAEGHTDRQTLLTIHRKIQDFTDLAVG